MEIKTPQTYQLFFLWSGTSFIAIYTFGTNMDDVFAIDNVYLWEFDAKENFKYALCFSFGERFTYNCLHQWWCNYNKCSKRRTIRRRKKIHMWYTHEEIMVQVCTLNCHTGCTFGEQTWTITDHRGAHLNPKYSCLQSKKPFLRPQMMQI